MQANVVCFFIALLMTLGVEFAQLGRVEGFINKVFKKCPSLGIFSNTRCQVIIVK